MEKAITLYQIRNLIKEYDRAELSLSRFTEILNEKAEEYAQSKIDALQSVSGSLPKIDPLDDENSDISKIGKEIANMTDEEFEENLKKIEGLFKKHKENNR